MLKDQLIVSRKDASSLSQKQKLMGYSVNLDMEEYRDLPMTVAAFKRVLGLNRNLPQ
jgi:hypothetical protein